MRYSTALVLSILAAGQAAAGGLRHASFHDRRHAEAKRSPIEYDVSGVDWSKVSIDLSGVDWSSVFAPEKPAPTPAPAPAPSVPEQPATPEITSAPAPAPPAPAPSATKEEAPEEPESNPIEGVVNDLAAGVSSVLGRLGISKWTTGVNAQNSDAQIWLGEDSNWRMEVINDAQDDIFVACWASNGFTGMSINVNQPLIFINLAVGATQKISVKQGVPGACAAVYPDTDIALFGGVNEPWAEFNFGPSGAFDVSRNINMNGHPVSISGSKCKSTMEQCVFKCKDDVSSCETGYDLFGQDAPGCGGGYDEKMGGTGGGCSMSSAGERLTITFS